MERLNLAGEIKIIDISKDQTLVNDELIAHLEKHLKLAKEGEIVLFTSIAMLKDNKNRWARGIFKGGKTAYNNYLAFCEMYDREKQRFKEFIINLYGEDDG